MDINLYVATGRKVTHTTDTGRGLLTVASDIGKPTARTDVLPIQLDGVHRDVFNAADFGAKFWLAGRLSRHFDAGTGKSGLIIDVKEIRAGADQLDPAEGI